MGCQIKAHMSLLFRKALRSSSSSQLIFLVLDLKAFLNKRLMCAFIWQKIRFGSNNWLDSLSRILLVNFVWFRILEMSSSFLIESSSPLSPLLFAPALMFIGIFNVSLEGI